ncbi:MAG: hypothetical protein HY360_17080 [Verrucomicrobia bacterium]|nr:hypothetical protein [Verrucomicrobiota bacterium]
MNLFIDDKPATPPDSLDGAGFEAFCQFCGDHLLTGGRAIQSVRMDGKDVDCVNPPSDLAFSAAERVEVTTCPVEELVLVVLRHQAESACALGDEAMELSTDCLIELPQDVLKDWRSVLESLKPLLQFTPKLLMIQAMTGVEDEKFSEANLTARILDIQNAVDTARQSLESLDVVVFSDTLELKIVPWLKEHGAFAEKLLQTIQSRMETAAVSTK